MSLTQYNKRPKASSLAKDQDSKSWHADLLLIFTDIIYRIGISGFIVVFICWFIWAYATEDQKIEIIDRYVLLKNIPAQSFPVKLIACAVTIYFIEAYFFMKFRRLDKLEIDRLLAFKKMFEEYGLNKSTGSSK